MVLIALNIACFVLFSIAGTLYAVKKKWGLAAILYVVALSFVGSIVLNYLTYVR